MVTKIFDGVSIASGGTETATFDLGRYDQSIALFITADSNGSNMDITFEADPDNDVVTQFFEYKSAAVTGNDLTSGQMYKPDLEPADHVQVSVTNQGAAASTVDAWVAPHNT